MKIHITLLGFAIMAFMLASCDEEEDPAIVWGSFSCNSSGCPGSFTMKNKTLAESGGQRYGYCRYNGNKFEFLVADNPPNKLGSGFYFKIAGIQGPPTAGVYAQGKNFRDDPKFPRSFQEARIKAGGHEWEIDGSDIPDDGCYVELFGEAKGNETTTKEYGNNPFQYYISVRCTGLDITDKVGDNPMSGFDATVFLDNCG